MEANDKAIEAAARRFYDLSDDDWNNLSPAGRQRHIGRIQPAIAAYEAALRAAEPKGRAVIVFLKFPTRDDEIYVRRDAIVTISPGRGVHFPGSWLRITDSGSADYDIFVAKTPQEVLLAIDRSEPTPRGEG